MTEKNQSEPRAASCLAQETLEQTLARWARQEEEARSTAATKLAEILDRIRHDFPQRKYLVAGYNGCGDDGCFEYLGFVETEEDAENAHPWNPPESLIAEFPEGIDERSLEDQLSHFIPSGYENNEGGQGVVRINLETGEVEVDHEYSVTEVVSEPRSFQLDAMVESTAVKPAEES